MLQCLVLKTVGWILERFLFVILTPGYRIVILFSMICSRPVCSSPSSWHIFFVSTRTIVCFYSWDAIYFLFPGHRYNMIFSQCILVVWLNIGIDCIPESKLDKYPTRLLTTKPLSLVYLYSILLRVGVTALSLSFI